MNTRDFELDREDIPEEILRSVKKLERSVIFGDTGTPPRNELVTLYNILREMLKFSMKNEELTPKVAHYIKDLFLGNKNLDGETEQIVALFAGLETSDSPHKQIKKEILKRIRSYEKNKLGKEDLELDMEDLPKNILESLTRFEENGFFNEDWIPTKLELLELYDLFEEMIKYSQEHPDLTMKIGNYINSALIFNRNLDEETDEIVSLFGQLELPEPHASWGSRPKIKEEILKLINEYKTNKLLIN